MYFNYFCSVRLIKRKTLMRKVSFILTVLLFNIANISVFANSGPTYWYGADSSNIIMRENCPLVVEKEVLTFDIYNQLDEYYSENDAEEFKTYTDKFTAEYTFYNPTDKDITAQLAFPIGVIPQYVNLERDMSKYSVLLNGADIEKEIRYTKSDDYYAFDYNKEVIKLADGYIEDDFYSPDMLVTKYTLIPHVDEEADYRQEIRIRWDGSISDKTRILPLRINSFQWMPGDIVIIGGSLTQKNPIVIYTIVQPFEKFPEYKFYESGQKDAKEIDASIEIIQEETTLIEMLDELYANINKKWNVSQSDTYNMFVSSITSEDYYTKTGIIHTEDIYFYSENLICWYLYEITVHAGEKVTNTVTAPLYPDISLNYKPYKYSYKYLLSPAQNWADFGNIEININTPFYLLQSNQDLEKTETGYLYKGEGLPDGELEFTLCESSNPQKEKASPYLLLIFLPIIGVFALCAGFVILMIKLAGRKKNK